MTEQKETIPFEKAFERLETILEKMNSGHLSLDDSLKFYEEADGLISLCSKQLTAAEKRIEVLVKNRNNEVSIGPDGKPMTKPFETT
jgi:exodeoxyribonuclease VII small subunit